MNVGEYKGVQRVSKVNIDLTIKMGHRHNPLDYRTLPPRRNLRLHPQRGLRQELSIYHCIIGNIKSAKV